MRGQRIKIVLRWALAVFMVGAGVKHFTSADFYVSIMPDYIPGSWHLELVYVSGVFEILGGLGLVVALTRRAAAWGLILLFIAVFPANVHMALHDVPTASGSHVPQVLLWLRLPLQGVLIAWAWWYTRPEPD